MPTVIEMILTICLATNCVNAKLRDENLVVVQFKSTEECTARAAAIRTGILSKPEVSGMVRRFDAKCEGVK